MISQANSSTVGTAYLNNRVDNKTTKESTIVSKETSSSKIDKLKESLDSGEYKVNVQSLSEKMADSLL
jgi:anti-sigma28 factor (negative regulator of flagellin synthesis)